MPAIRQRLPQARIVMLTAYASLDLATSALARGASHFLAKPLTPALLRAAIAAARPWRCRQAAFADPARGGSMRDS